MAMTSVNVKHRQNAVFTEYIPFLNISIDFHRIL